MAKNRRTLSLAVATAAGAALLTPSAAFAAPASAVTAPAAVTSAPAAVASAPATVTSAPAAVTSVPAAVTSVPAAATSAPAAATSAPAPITKAKLRAWEKYMIDATNVSRKKAKKPILRVSNCLSRAAAPIAQRLMKVRTAGKKFELTQREELSLGRCSSQYPRWTYTYAWGSKYASAPAMMKALASDKTVSRYLLSTDVKFIGSATAVSPKREVYGLIVTVN